MNKKAEKEWSERGKKPGEVSAPETDGESFQERCSQVSDAI